MSYLKLNSFVNDFSNCLIEENIDIYNKKFFFYEKETDIQIATVFIKHRKWRELKDIALEIFNKNWIWNKETNSWLLLVVVTEEKKIRIMTWKWMEIEFPNSLAREIIEWELRWLLNDGDFNGLLKSWYELWTKSRKVKKYIWSNKNNNITKEIENEIESDKNFKYYIIFISILMRFLILVFLVLLYIFKFWIFFWIWIFFIILVIFDFIKKEKKEYLNFIILLSILIFFTSIFWLISKEQSRLNNFWFNSNFSISNSSSSSYDLDSNFSDYDSDWWGWESNGWGWWD